jgi:NAD(P)-dependent dehydrogenase (short-subunit alcohol dehydrogenase family)
MAARYRACAVPPTLARRRNEEEIEMARLEGRVAVVTGGASGIGAATVKRFVDEGARVVIADVQDEKGHALAASLPEATLYRHVDVANEDDVRGVVASAVERFGRLDVMFNNAGFGGARGPIESTSLDEYERTMNVLLRGVFLGMKHAAPVMKQQASGSIVSTASVAGLRAGFAPHLYATAKAAVIALTRTVACELAESGVRVNCICPGGVATPLLGQAFGPGDAGVELIKPWLAQMQPLARAGVGEDIAAAAAWLASDDASFVTGHALVVDGGLTSGPRWSTWAPPMREHVAME